METIVKLYSVLNLTAHRCFKLESTLVSEIKKIKYYFKTEISYFLFYFFKTEINFYVDR